MEVGVFMSPTDVDQLAAKVAAMVLKEVTRIKAIEEPLTKQGAADYFKISVRALDDRIANGKIPAKLIHRNGGTPYFFASELEAHLKKANQ